jgi:hypothetical protein
LIDRRAFLVQGGVLAVAGAAWRWHAAAGTAPAFDAPTVAVVDRDVAGSNAFAAAARARGVRVLEFSADVASLWMQELEPRLRVGPVVIEGYTRAATQFCLEFLARDYGARTVHHAEAGAAVSWLLSSSPARRAALAPISARGSESHA